MISGGPRERRVELNGLSLHYLEWGENNAPTLLLLHGFLSQAHIWYSLASQFTPAYRVVALNQRGHGKSGWSTDGAYSIDDHFTDLAQFIERLNLRDLILIGHSMGGRNALFYTACIPDRIAKLVLVDARPGNSDESIMALKRMLDSIGFGYGDLEDFLENAQTLYPDLSLKASFDLIHSRETGDFGSRSVSSYDPWMIIASRLAEFMVEELWPFMGGIPCPTLIVRGEYSTFVSQEEAQNMCQMIPRAEIAVIPRASHLPMIENHTAFKEAVLSFLD